MNSFLKWLAGNSLIRAQVLGIARHVASSLAGAVGLWLAAHGADQSVTADASQAVLLLVSATASYGFSIWDKNSVADKITTAANDSAVAVAQASPEPPSPQTVSDIAAIVGKGGKI